MFQLLLLSLVMGQTTITPSELPAWKQLAFLEGVESVVLMFHVNWCGACKRTLPEFMQTQFDSKTTRLAAIDLTDHKAFGEELGITGFPDIRIETRNNQMTPIPYYYRDVLGLSNFIARISAPDWTIVDKGTLLSDLVEEPRFGHSHSFVYYSKNDQFLDIFSHKSKIQFLKVHSKERVSPNCDSNTCGILIPRSSLLISPSVGLSLYKGSELLDDYLKKNLFSNSVWRIRTSQEFQFFNDQSKFKVFGASQCDGSELFSFARLDNPNLAESMKDEFGTNNFILSNEPLDFSKYWPLGENFDCEQLETLVQASPSYRGNWITRGHGMYKDILKEKFGIDSEIGQISVFFGIFLSIFFTIMFVAIRNSKSMSEYIHTAESIVVSPIAGKRISKNLEMSKKTQ